ncbi:MAG: class III poly(R)-hydroxyalkanoic acid synthase subunit PhaE [Pseudoxanthomonas sp.]
MVKSGFGNTGDFEAMARQYWSAWGDAMRQGGMGAAATPQPAQQWQQAVDWWSQLLPDGRSQANDAVGRFNQQASQWFGQMQQVAAQFAGQDSSAREVSQAWRQAMGANGDGNPFTDLFKAMRGQGAHGMDEWLDQVKPYLEGFQQQSQRWQQLPAFGQYREHQERWQALQLAQQEYQQQSEVFNALMLKCAQRAFEVFEDKLIAHEEPGRQITSARALFDLWIDSAEQAYAVVALSAEFRKVQGALTNAQMRLRAAIQLEVEHMTGLFGMPTRTEIDSAHRKVAELERALRRAASAARPVSEPKATRAPRPQEPVAPPAKSKPQRATRKPAVARKSKPASKPAARKPMGKPAPKRRMAARKLAAKPAIMEQKAPAKRVAKAQPGKVVASKPAARKVSVPARKAAARKPAEKKAAPARSGSNKVVSMKDWVARYAAMNTPDTIGKGKARK